MLTILDWRAADDPVSEMDCARISPGESAFKETEVQQDSDHLDPLESMIDQTLADSFPASAAFLDPGTRNKTSEWVMVKNHAQDSSVSASARPYFSL
jgi:hypothetical protein